MHDQYNLVRGLHGAECVQQVLGQPCSIVTAVVLCKLCTYMVVICAAMRLTRLACASDLDREYNYIYK